MKAAMAAPRWVQLRLSITRGVGLDSHVSLVLRQGDGRVVFDRRLDTAVISTPPGSGASRSPVLALVEAVVALAGKRGELTLLTGTLAEPPAPLEGPQGGSDQLRLDLPGYNQLSQPPPGEQSPA